VRDRAKGATGAAELRGRGEARAPLTPIGLANAGGDTINAIKQAAAGGGQVV